MPSMPSPFADKLLLLWNNRYEDYLDSQINTTDVYYLEDVELARHLVELG